MTLIDRLIAAGVKPEAALEDASWYLYQGGGVDALRVYVEGVEMGVPALESQR